MKILDIHIYYGSSLYGKSLSSQSLAHLKKEHPSLETALVPAKPPDYLYPPACQEVEEYCLSNAGNYALLRVDPWRKREAISQIQQSKSKVLFLHPMEEQFYPNHPQVKEVVEEASAKGMAILLASGYLPFSHPSQILPLVQSFPRIPFILTHGGQINICGLHMKEAWEIFQTAPNTFFETSSIYRQDYIEQAVQELGAERVLFGSGAPLYDWKYEWKRIEILPFSESVKEKILYSNAKNFL